MQIWLHQLEAISLMQLSTHHPKTIAPHPAKRMATPVPENSTNAMSHNMLIIND